MSSLLLALYGLKGDIYRHSVDQIKPRFSSGLFRSNFAEKRGVKFAFCEEDNKREELEEKGRKWRAWKKEKKRGEKTFLFSLQAVSQYSSSCYICLLAVFYKASIQSEISEPQLVHTIIAIQCVSLGSPCFCLGIQKQIYVVVSNL